VTIKQQRIGATVAYLLAAHGDIQVTIGDLADSERNHTPTANNPIAGSH
jgi:hypothetical protein